jgi:hypothetical protein
LAVTGDHDHSADAHILGQGRDPPRATGLVRDARRTPPRRSADFQALLRSPFYVSVVVRWFLHKKKGTVITLSITLTRGYYLFFLLVRPCAAGSGGREFPFRHYCRRGNRERVQDRQPAERAAPPGCPMAVS